jgi:hypothetical protein
MQARQLYRQLATLPRRALAHWPLGLMIFLLILPSTLPSNSVFRLVANQSEESCPLTQSEERSEEAREETGRWELVDRSPPASHAAVLRSRRLPASFFRPFSTRAAEQLAQNGCGATLRC